MISADSIIAPLGRSNGDFAPSLDEDFDALANKRKYRGYARADKFDLRPSVPGYYFEVMDIPLEMPGLIFQLSIQMKEPAVEV